MEHAWPHSSSKGHKAKWCEMISSQPKQNTYFKIIIARGARCGKMGVLRHFWGECKVGQLMGKQVATFIKRLGNVPSLCFSNSAFGNPPEQSLEIRMAQDYSG